MGRKPQKRSRRLHIWRVAALWTLIAVAYSNSFEGALVFDSASIVGQDPRIRTATVENGRAIVAGGYWYAVPTAGLYRPLTTLSYLVNYSVLGDGASPAGYHWINFLLHEGNVALVYALAALLFGEAAPAMAVAAIWGVHPLLTEAVSNVAGRADLLAAMGVLAGLLCYIRGGRSGWLAAAQALAVFSKESGVVLPVLMLLYDVTFEKRRRAVAYAAVLAPIAVFFILRIVAGVHMRVEPGDNPLVTADFFASRVTAVNVVGRYLWLFLWPARLSADYSYNAIAVSPWPGAGVLLAAGAGVLAVLAPRLPRFFLLFFLISLAPVSNMGVLIGSIMAERFLYLPSLGLAGCVVAAAYAWPRRPVWAVAAVLCALLAARTYARNRDWHDGLSLWTSAVEVVPGSAKAHYNRAKELERIPGRLPDAVAEYREAVRIEPNRADAHDNLANLLAAMDLLTEAIEEYRAALRLAPDAAAVHNDLANALARVPGRLPEAVAEYRAALRLQPGNAEVHYNLGNALSALPDRLLDAIAEYRAALQLQPDHADAHNNLGNALAAIPGRLPEAVEEYRAALRIQPDMAAAQTNLANALERLR